MRKNGEGTVAKQHVVTSWNEKKLKNERSLLAAVSRSPFCGEGPVTSVVSI